MKRSFFVFDHTPVRQPLDDRVGSGLGPVQLLLAQPGKLRAFDGLVLPEDQAEAVLAFKYFR